MRQKLLHVALSGMNQRIYTGYFADCYVLAPERTAAFVISFLTHFVPNHSPTQDEYEFPHHGPETTETFASAEDLIDFLTKDSGASYAMYWTNNDKSEIRFAQCFFTNDGHLIVGLSCECEGYPVTTTEEAIFNGIKAFCGGAPGYITYESPAPDNLYEFLRAAE